MIEFSYLKQPPKRYTFEQPKLKKWVENRCKGLVLNLFAGKVMLNVHEIRIDIDPKFAPDYCMDAYEFVKTTKLKFDTIIFDPPYSQRKSREKYQGHWIGKATKIKRLLPRVMNPICRVILFGFNSNGMGLGFERKEICLVNHGGDHSDTIVVIEDKMGDITTFNKKV